MLIELLIFWLIIFPLITFFLIKKFIFKGIFKALILNTIIWLILTIIIVIIAVNMVVSDVNSLKDNFEHNVKYLIYEKNDYAIFGAEITDLNFNSVNLDEGELPFTALQRSELDQLMNERKQKGINKLIITFNQKTLEGANANIHFELENMSFDFKRDKLIEILESDDIKDDIAEIMAEQSKSLLEESPIPLNENIVKGLIKLKLAQFESDELKTIVAGLIIKDIIEQRGSIFIFEQFKQKNLQVYPDYLVLSLLKETPEQFLQNAISKAK